MSVPNDTPSIQLPLFDCVEIPLTQEKIALVDACDSDLLGIKWYAHKNRNVFYALHHSCSNNIDHYLSMHRVILARKLGHEIDRYTEVDHIDGNGLNNRRSNLRAATRTENLRNRGRRSTNTSGFKGVSWSKSEKRWRAKIWGNGHLYHLGYFSKAEDAYAAYCEAAIKYHGEFARLK